MSRVDRFHGEDSKKQDKYNGFSSKREARIAAKQQAKEAAKQAKLEALYEKELAKQNAKMEAREAKSARRNAAPEKPSGYDDHEYNQKQYKKQRKKGKHRFLKRFILFMLILCLAGGGAGAAYAFKCISEAPVIHPEKMYETLDLSTYIYDDQGNRIESIFYENRKLVKYEELPDNLKNAFIAIEDKTFWKHHGFNFKRMIGAVLGSLTGRSISGTSTITQQLARNVFLAEVKSERSIKRKIIEMYYAYEIEEALSKEEILEAYLNTIYLGYGSYGVHAASKTYFGKTKLESLTLEQCAALAALPQAPDTYALLKNEKGEATTKLEKGLYANDISKDRRELVLDLMAEQGYISAEEAEAAKKPLKDFIKPNLSTGAQSRTYFKDYVIDQVIADLMDTYGKSEQEATAMVYGKGLRIYSTLDTQAQRIISKEFKKDSNFPNTVKGKKPEAAMVIVEVGTGKIKAMAGGRKPNGERLLNRAVIPRQPGSSIKPLAVYGAALQKSYELQQNKQYYSYNEYVNRIQMGKYITTSSVIDDAPMTVNGSNWPQNAGGGYMGKVTFREAIQQSINTCAVKILMQVGVEYSSQQVQQFGISTLRTDTSNPVNDMNYASLALGGMSDGVTPLDMALAYATFPNGGVRNSAICYTKVTDRNGKVILKGKSTETKVLDKGVAWIMTDVLKSVVTDGIAGAANISGVQSGGKTGTTNDQYDIWFDGFTPNYAASLWIGTDKNVELTTMSGPAAALWGKIMNQIKNAKKGEYKKAPSNVVKVRGEYYTQGTVPKNEENVLPDSETRTDTMDGDDGTGHGYGDDPNAAMVSNGKKNKKKKTQ